MSIIYIVGASGSGTSTIGEALSKVSNYHFVDLDEIFWEKTDPPFTKSRPLSERVIRLKETINRYPDLILSGSMSKWGEDIYPDLTYVIFVQTETNIRIERIKQREKNRFQERILENNDMYEAHQEFLKWAQSYDTFDETKRSLKRHLLDIKNIKKPTLIVNGGDTLSSILGEIQLFLKEVAR